jgi:hypothetical protein
MNRYVIVHLLGNTNPLRPANSLKSSRTALKSSAIAERTAISWPSSSQQ